jgi:hypothetical protein
VDTVLLKLYVFWARKKSASLAMSASPSRSIASSTPLSASSSVSPAALIRSLALAAADALILAATKDAKIEPRRNFFLEYYFRRFAYIAISRIQAESGQTKGVARRTGATTICAKTPNTKHIIMLCVLRPTLLVAALTLAAGQTWTGSLTSASYFNSDTCAGESGGESTIASVVAMSDECTCMAAAGNSWIIKRCYSCNGTLTAGLVWTSECDADYPLPCSLLSVKSYLGLVCCR